MTSRIDYAARSPRLFKAMLDFSTATAAATIDATIRLLVDIRASQLNGCAFCLDMHVKQARLQGERELRIHHLPVWRESALFTSRERAALAWTEALTHIGPDGVPDALYDRVRTEFSEQELVDLSFSVMAINAWNRVNVAFRTAPGSKDAAWGLDKAGLE